ncbi:MAG: sugar ABC transporter permease [Gemmatimonadetes bacterium]|nr:sugar ABC transporter permease [Gemmatimonadota bacterium]MBT4610176.1 sugar ABC transporter permease [Gemmatimonadota bacterium]MBT5146222.1 sugar ABC transporter permease [Gemmatimonadota bacterium]MBT7455896.1 sugar ABC transporter permease [Gemmatimonadota bacterium]MBT7593493.1 sugar ABC transporter permease [Gemmatimonadota bacterium]
MQSTLGCYGIVLPSLALLTLFVYLPVAWAFVGSVYEFEIGSEAQFVGFAHYAEYLWQDPTALPSLLNMLALTLIAVAVRLSFPLIVARLIYALPTERWRYVYRVIFLAPVVVPGVAIQLIWSGMIFSDAGLLNQLLEILGLAHWSRGWLADPETALLAVAAVGFPFVGGFEVLIYYAGFSSIPESVNEAAAIDGCTGWQKFFRIDIPMVLSQLKLILILTIIGGVQGFEHLFILTRGGPGFETTVPGLWMYFNAFSFQRMGYACAIGVLLFILVFGLTTLNLRYFKSSEQLQGVR